MAVAVFTRLPLSHSCCWQCGKILIPKICYSSQILLWCPWKLETKFILSSALSQLNCRVNRFEFRSGIVDPHLPVNATLGGVDIVRPGFCFLTQTGDISEAAVCDALVRERTQCILSDVQPTAMLRRVAELEASHQGASTLGGKRFIERALGVGVEVVAHQDHLAAGSIATLQQSRHFDGPIALRFAFANSDFTPAGQRFGEHEDGGRPRAFVFVVNPLAVPGCGSNG